MKKGFSLLEILITVIILTIGVVAISRAFSAGIFASASDENVELALGIAQTKLEDIYGTLGGVANEARHDVSQDGFVGGIYADQDFEVEVQTDDNNPERVDVTVYWDTTSGEANITLTTLVADY